MPQVNDAGDCGWRCRPEFTVTGNECQFWESCQVTVQVLQMIEGHQHSLPSIKHPHSDFDPEGDDEVAMRGSTGVLWKEKYRRKRL
jgi:hypothetical protein